MHVGDVVTIRLPENAAAGIGSAGTAVWTLCALCPGQARVTPKKSRVWEDTPSARFAVILDIAA